MPKFTLKSNVTGNPKRWRRAVEREVLSKADPKDIQKTQIARVAQGFLEQKKRRISQGQSPITGKRFPRYKNPDRYPGGLKPSRPVNLRLTGDFLRDLVFRVITGKNPAIEIFFKTNESQLKEQGHREGANGQPKRPIIPNQRETYSRGLRRRLDALLQSVIDRAFK